MKDEFNKSMWYNESPNPDKKAVIPEKVSLQEENNNE